MDQMAACGLTNMVEFSGCEKQQLNRSSVV